MGARGASAARRYAKAVFGLAQEEGRVEQVQEELGTLQDLIRRHPALHEVLVRPLHPAPERRRVLEALAGQLGMSPLFQKFCAFLIDQRRMLDLPTIVSEYGRLADEAAGRTHAEVVSASPLEDKQLERLRRALSARTGRDVQLSLRVDPELIAGAVARVSGLVFDGSLKTQLAQLRARLVKER